MSDPVGERFPLHMRDGERSSRTIQALTVERFGDLVSLEMERPLSPAQRLADTP